jgi:hypothetical protein
VLKHVGSAMTFQVRNSAMNVRRGWKIDPETTYVNEHLRWAFLKDVRSNCQ